MSLKEIASNKENWIFAGAQMGAGLLNYIFQILAAQQLSATEFGLWSGWLATFSFFLFFSIWVQSLMTLQGSLPFQLNPLGAWSILVGLAGLSVFSAIAGYEDIAGWTWMLVFSIFFGLGLSHRLLLAVAAGTVIATLSKFAIVFAFPHYEGYRWAILFAPAFACVLFLIYLPSFQARSTGKPRMNRQVILSALFLAVAAALIPQLDLLSAKAMLTTHQLGGFAKVALIYKGIFFFLMILFQVLVTYQIRGITLQISWLNLGSLYVLGLLVAFILPHFGLLAFLPSEWITGATVHIVSLSLIFFLIQQEAAQQRWLWPAGWTAILGIEYALARWGNLNLVNYWMVGIALETVALLAFLLLRRTLLGAKAEHRTQ